MRYLNLVTLTNATDLVLFAVPPSFMQWASSIPQQLGLSEDPLTLSLPQEVVDDLTPFLIHPLTQTSITLSSENKAYSHIKQFLPLFRNEEGVRQWANEQGCVVKGDEFFGRLY